MAALFELYSHQFLIFVLVLTRLSGVLMLMPVLGAKAIPMRIRGLLAVGLTMIIAPTQWHVPLPEIGSLMQLVVMVGREALIGLSIGLATAILFAGVQLAGQVVSQTAGVSLADVLDPSFESSVSAVTQLMDMLTMAVFVCMGGHRQVFAALLDTFRWTPAGAATFPEGVVAALTDITSQSFAAGFRAGAPCLLALLLAVLITAIVSRTLPQLNVLVLGFNLNAAVLIGGLAVSLGATAWVFQEEFASVLAAVSESLAS